MENTAYVAISRHAALWRQLEAVANNMANVNTPSFKGEQVMFKEFLVRSAVNGSQAAGEKVSFVTDVGVLRNMREGPMTKTDNPLDVGIEGQGYFVIETPDGPRYTRNGHFRLDETGMIVNSEGYALLQTGDTPIVIAPNEKNVQINRDGSVVTENGQIAKLRVVRFESDQRLRKAAGGLYDTDQTAEDVPSPKIHQGMVEESNVQPVQELTNMIAITRQYEGVQKMLDNDNERQLKAYDVLSQPAKT